MLFALILPELVAKQAWFRIHPYGYIISLNFSVACMPESAAMVHQTSMPLFGVYLSSLGMHTRLLRKGICLRKCIVAYDLILLLLLSCRTLIHNFLSRVIRYGFFGVDILSVNLRVRGGFMEFLRCDNSSGK